MQPRHGTRTYDTSTGREAAPLHNVESFAQFFHKLWDLEEIITVIGIAHDDIFPSGRQNSTHKGTAISPLSDTDYAGAQLCRDSLTPIATSIIGDDDFSCYFLFI